MLFYFNFLVQSTSAVAEAFMSKTLLAPPVAVAVVAVEAAGVQQQYHTFSVCDLCTDQIVV